MVMTTLAHHIDEDFLREAYKRTRKDAAPGIDAVSAEEYEANLDNNLRSLLARFKNGTYRAPPVRRVHIPKNDGRSTRPIGIPTLEDKVLQTAVRMVLEAVYEQDFDDVSFGFRPSRSQHQALEMVWKGLMDVGGGWVLELDIEDFFGSVDHSHLRDFLDLRVRDGVLRRAINKWLKAGVMEEGQLSRPELGVPQGGSISPLLSNVYLHEVLDRWFRTEVQPRLRGQSMLVRFADDAVIVFEREDDARRVLDVIPKRFARFGLKLHPEKTRLIDFRKPPRNGGRPSFDLLGFTHFWTRSRRKKWIVGRKTATTRFSRAVRRVSEWCRNHRHMKVMEQHRELSRKIRGHYGYYGITGNSRALARFVRAVERIWRKWLDRRSQRARMKWERFKLLLLRFPLPPPRIVHSYRRVAKSSA
jgi:group II intron reverse transcriptase/maturase